MTEEGILTGYYSYTGRKAKETTAYTKQRKLYAAFLIVERFGV